MIADVAVIGGGVIGAAITYYLTLRGLSVVLVERGDLASGASGACGGSVSMQTKREGPVLACAMRSQEQYRALGDELGRDLEYEERGSLIVAETAAEHEYLTKLAAEQSAAGLKVDWLDGAAAARECRVELAPSVVAARYCPTDAEVNPLAVVFAYADAAKRRGARLWTHTRASRILMHNDRVVGVETERGDLAAPIVVNAAGAWAPAVGEMVSVSVPVKPRRGVVLVTEPVPFPVRGTVFSTRYLMSKRPSAKASAGGVELSFSGGLVLAQTLAGNLLIGSSRDDVGFDARTPPEIVEFIAQEAVRILPALSSVSVIRAYAGLRPLASDGLPIIGAVPGLSGFVLATGHEGDGVALAPWTGKAVAALVESGRPSDDLAPFSPQRFDVAAAAERGSN
jgi:sarcosine oxidase subunit beta